MDSEGVKGLERVKEWAEYRRAVMLRAATVERGEMEIGITSGEYLCLTGVIRKVDLELERIGKSGTEQKEAQQGESMSTETTEAVLGRLRERVTHLSRQFEFESRCLAEAKQHEAGHTLKAMGGVYRHVAELLDLELENAKKSGRGT